MTGMLNIKRYAAILAIAALPTAATAADKVDHAMTPYPLTDLFDTPPPRATAAPGTSCVTADHYVGSIAADKKDELGGYFAEDAALLTPFGELVRGRKNIQAWYDANHGKMAAAVPVGFYPSGNDCWMELAAKFVADPEPRFRLLTGQHFTMNDRGEIVRLVHYFRTNMNATKQAIEDNMAKKK
jgi:hypothetical protein